MDGQRIVGIDCAVDPANVGVALGEFRDGRAILLDAVQCGKKRSVVDAACEFAEGSPKILFALDAPLGWPTALGATLAKHRAGMAISSIDHTLFRRRTDEVVAKEAKQTPFDVGADRIARTAVAALTLLTEIRTRLDAEIPLAWGTPADSAIAAIEVYPAATLRRLWIESRKYKEPKHVETRMRIFDALGATADLRAIRGVAEGHADAFDAAICVIAGVDFLLGRCRAPREDELPAALHEGWIWVRSK